MSKLSFPYKLIFFILFNIALVSCSSDDASPPIPTGLEKQYTFVKTQFSDLTGNVIFTENTNGSTTISVSLNNTVPGVDLNIRLRRNTANLGGGIALTLNNIDNETGKSITTVSKLDDGNAINYVELSEFEGYLSLEGKNTNQNIVFAYKDLGPNEFTGKKITYHLFSNNQTVNGFAQFQERRKGTSALIIGVLDLTNPTALECSLLIKQDNTTSDYIHELASTRIEPNGYSFNELTEINGSPITFDALLNLDAFINVSDPANPLNILSSGAIGINENASSY
ncbi:hypothetical protein [Maribacter sp. IgM3_T14_3]|uniref:hypothetical protein n=1 Tax=Maribacter sp. IgM3_T14_3 TaxID=3415140 RepID=UPI003C6FEFE2